MAGTDAGVLPHSPREIVPPRSRPPVVLPAVMAAEGAAFAVPAGLDGSAAWQAARVLTVVVVTAWAVWFTRRTGRAGRGVTALALGIAGTAAGAGVGSAHVAKAGLDAAAAVAAAVLAAGVVLLVWGAACRVHPQRGARAGRGAGPARLRRAAGRYPRARPLRWARDGLRLVG